MDELLEFLEKNYSEEKVAEIVYTVGTFSGAGPIIGYLNIEDK